MVEYQDVWLVLFLAPCKEMGIRWNAVGDSAVCNASVHN